jgi:hypothetical protein
MNTDYAIVMPAYNDWESVGQLLQLLDRELSSAGHRARLVVVNDGSTQILTSSQLGLGTLPSFTAATLLNLVTNLGHQRAIAVGLAHLASDGGMLDVVVMDSDGQDAPADVPRLVRAARASDVPALVFASRTHRSEPLAFRIAYAVYTLLFRMLTGNSVRFGNFSMIPAEFVQRLGSMPELWNHYAAAAIKSRLPRRSIDSRREVRLGGTSKMNAIALVSHGLSAISVFSDVVGVRLLFLLLGVAVTWLATIAGILSIRALTAGVIPSWATASVGIPTLLFTNALLLVVTFLLCVLSNRSVNLFVPARDYKTFVRDIVALK